MPKKTGITHDVKISSKWKGYLDYFLKTFEIRKNDRNYKEGDEIIFHEYENGKYTGKTSKALILYVLYYEDFPIGLQPGYCILSLDVWCEE